MAPENRSKEVRKRDGRRNTPEDEAQIDKHPEREREREERKEDWRGGGPVAVRWQEDERRRKEQARRRGTDVAN
jgi:hypothetical protein